MIFQFFNLATLLCCDDFYLVIDYVVAGPLYRAGFVSLIEPDMALFTLTLISAKAMPDFENFLLRRPLCLSTA